MTRTGRLIYDGFLVMRDEFWMVFLSNFLWLVLCLPIITIPLAFAGLYSCARGLVYGESVRLHSFFLGIKKYFGASLRWTAANLLVLFVLSFYIWYFLYQPSNLRDTWRNLGYVFIVLAILWSILNMYTFPFMLEQEKMSYLNAIRNSTVMFIKWPGQALGFALFNLLVFVLSFWLWLPWLVLGASLPALMSCLCVKDIADQINEISPVKS